MPVFWNEVVNSVLRKEQVLEDKQLPMKYPLKVSQNNVEIFTQVSVDLDISIFGEMSRLVREFEHNHKSLRFSHCPDGRLHIEGSFSAMKELRKDLQRRLGEFQVLPPLSSAFKSGANASSGKSAKLSSDNATRSTAPQRVATSPSYGAGDALDPAVFVEESTVILDADIFEYINKICKDQYQSVLFKYCVRATVTNNEAITVLHLEKAHDQCEPSQLRTAKLEIEKLISELQQLLVSERIRLDGGKGRSKMLALCKEITQHSPMVLVRVTDGYVTLIGSYQHCSQFKKEVEEKVKAMESMFDSVSSGNSHILNTTGLSHHSSQRLGSNVAHGLDEPTKSEYSLNQNSHSGQYAKSQADGFHTVSSGDDSSEKRRRSCDVVPLAIEPSSLPPMRHMGTSTVESMLDSTSAERSLPLNTTGYSYHSSQRLGSEATQRVDVPNRFDVPNKVVNGPKQCANSQADVFHTALSRDDSYGKWGRFPDIDSLASGPSSLPASSCMSPSTMYDRESRFDKSSSTRPPRF
ncbi:RNA-binding protein 43-like isoform X2 [Scyliorhinus torazame]|uniref:RNA-binding protein 43-like isoform X2 n=1 Tax=Scyliorhinus torazame TaxID=75743 RepID=UPI003B5BF84F